MAAARCVLVLLACALAAASGLAISAGMRPAALAVVLALESAFAAGLVPKFVLHR